MVDQLQAGITLEDVTQNEKYQALGQRQQKEFLRTVLPEIEPKAKSLNPEQFDYLLETAIFPNAKLNAPDAGEVAQNLADAGLNTIGSAFNQIGQFVGNIPQLPSQIADAAQQELEYDLKTLGQTYDFRNQMTPQERMKNLFYTGPGRSLPGATQAVADLLTGIPNLGVEGINAAAGSQVVPRVPRINVPGVEERPVSGFIGQNLPFMLPVAKMLALKATQGLSPVRQAVMENLLLGTLTDPGEAGASGRLVNASLGASLPLVVAGGAKGASALMRRGSAKQAPSTLAELAGDEPAISKSTAMVPTGQVKDAGNIYQAAINKKLADIERLTDPEFKTKAYQGLEKHLAKLVETKPIGSIEQIEAFRGLVKTRKQMNTQPPQAKTSKKRQKATEKLQMMLRQKGQRVIPVQGDVRRPKLKRQQGRFKDTAAEKRYIDMINRLDAGIERAESLKIPKLIQGELSKLQKQLEPLIKEAQTQMEKEMAIAYHKEIQRKKDNIASNIKKRQLEGKVDNATKKLEEQLKETNRATREVEKLLKPKAEKTIEAKIEKTGTGEVPKTAKALKPKKGRAPSKVDLVYRRLNSVIDDGGQSLPATDALQQLGYKVNRDGEFNSVTLGKKIRFKPGMSLQGLVQKAGKQKIDIPSILARRIVKLNDERILADLESSITKDKQANMVEQQDGSQQIDPDLAEAAQRKADALERQYEEQFEKQFEPEFKEVQQGKRTVIVGTVERQGGIKVQSAGRKVEPSKTDPVWSVREADKTIKGGLTFEQAMKLASRNELRTRLSEMQDLRFPADNLDAVEEVIREAPNSKKAALIAFKAAIEENKTFDGTYIGEKFGVRQESRPLVKSDVPLGVGVTKDTGDLHLRVINENGQLTTRIIKEGELGYVKRDQKYQSVKDVDLISEVASGKVGKGPPQYKMVLDESGKPIVLDTNGQIVSQETGGLNRVSEMSKQLLKEMLDDFEAKRRYTSADFESRARLLTRADKIELLTKAPKNLKKILNNMIKKEPC